VSIDTLRADFTGPYGRATARTTALDRLAREGTVYEQAYSPSTWTLPSHVSLFFGSNLPETPAILRRDARIAADTSIADRSLATILRGAGYLTAGFTGGGFLDWPFDLPRGFDTYFAFQQPPRTACAAERFDGATVFARALVWLRTNHQRPFFLFVHTYDVHDRCPFMPDVDAVGAWPELSAARNRELLAYYDGLISATDQRLAALLDTIDELGLRDSTLLIVTSDHGEAFSEHDARGHGCDMRPYEELSRVPLLLRFAQRVPAGARVATPISLIDVAPTALALLGLPSEAWMQGRLLPDLGLAAAPSGDRPVYVHCGDALAVRRGPFKLITSRAARYPDELYDLAQDAHEQHKLADHDTERAQLRADAAQFWTQAVGLSSPPPWAPAQQLDESTKERLRALGYIKE
jgi:arylsulfatase A-like enzyme